MIEVNIAIEQKDINDLIIVFSNKQKALKAIGQRHLKWINDNFKTEGHGKWAKLRPNTIAARRQGSSAILQDTGRLRMSFGMEIRGNTVHVGTDSKIAPYHEKGTRPYVITPKRARALRFVTTKGVVYSKRVKHPGLKKRPMLPSKAIASRIAIAIIKAIIKHGKN